MQQLLLTISPLVSMILITVSYLPQIKLTIKTKNVKGQSLGFWAILTGALIGTTFQQVGLISYSGVTNYLGLITQAINLLFAVWMLVMVIMYKNDDDDLIGG